jgi:deazaflavin-dependent oxidoreductase (nitroreductase family)
MSPRSLVRHAGRQRWFARCGRALVPLDRVVGRLSKGRVVGFGVLPALVITTTGRRSGRPRDNPLAYLADGDAYVVIGSNWGRTHHPAWTLNLLAEPAATVLVRGERIPVRARLVTGEERARLWAAAVARWPGYQAYADRAGRPLHMFRLEPAHPRVPG